MMMMMMMMMMIYPSTSPVDFQWSILQSTDPMTIYVSYAAN
jgi:hypothetical protein